VLDDGQREAARALQRLQDALLRQPATLAGALGRLLVPPRAPRGVYLWGGVGHGKSFVMDGFHDGVPLALKRRIHFHAFMQDIHARLAAGRREADPLRRIAHEIAREVRLLCLDEFQVGDIGDAMLLGGLLQGLFERGVALVTTSNTTPDALYAHGLQRARFLPAIALIKQHMQVVQLDGAVDYRLRGRDPAAGYLVSAGDAAEQQLAQTFRELAGGAGVADEVLQLAGRAVAARRQAPGVAWFDFGALCDGPRGKAEYHDLARRFPALLLSRVPQFERSLLPQARRFQWLVDALYEQRTQLVMAAAVPLAQLAPPGLLDGEFQRTLSRLAELCAQPIAHRHG
jgi:cell division protein ZapE